jgi:hypothetical protein
MENKERFPLSHGTATAIYMNLFTKFVALGLCMYPTPGGRFTVCSLFGSRFA